MNTTISVLGAGSWGSALAILAARNGCQTLLWGHNPGQIALLEQDNENARYLPGFPFPEQLSVTADLAEAAAFSDILLIAVPSHAFQQTLIQLKPYLPPDIRIAWATKGFNPDDGLLLDHTVEKQLSAKIPTAVLSGPTFAREVAADLPTAITIASRQKDFAADLANKLHSQRFRIYTSSDIIGVQVGGAIKNVFAIAAGIADGLGLGANTRAALITRGLTEIMRLGLAMGGKQETFMGLAGLGDLILTCTDNQSRNRRLGLALGQGKEKTEALKKLHRKSKAFLQPEKRICLLRNTALTCPSPNKSTKCYMKG